VKDLIDMLSFTEKEGKSDNEFLHKRFQNKELTCMMYQIVHAPPYPRMHIYMEKPCFQMHFKLNDSLDYCSLDSKDHCFRTIN